MKLIRFGKKKQEKPGILIGGERYDLSAYFVDWKGDFFSSGGLEKLKSIIETELHRIPKVSIDERWAACVAKPSKIVCVGLNYAGHVKEMKREISEEPTLFFKSPSAVCGAYDPIIIPKTSQKTDYEVEMAVLIKKEAHYLESEQEAVKYIAGYMAANDVSERAFQIEKGGLWCKGKSSDNFCPLGPWLLTADEMPMDYNLNLRLSVNGELRQNQKTELMLRKPEYLVYYISQFMTLEAGDVILTGTPEGVGKGRTPEVYLKESDEVLLEIENLGQQKMKCIAFDSPIL
jgi:2,4-didehydro-3-deoxy-L-rhamnonate hydrolase